MMNPNFRELGDSAFNADNSISLEIESCLNCGYFKSYRDSLNDLAEPSEFGFCEYPFMVKDETMGLGMVCDFHRIDNISNEGY